MKPVHCSNHHPLVLPVVYLKGGTPLLQAPALPKNTPNFSFLYSPSTKIILIHSINSCNNDDNPRITSLITGGVLAVVFAAITAATVPRGKGELGVAAAMIG